MENQKRPTLHEIIKKAQEDGLSRQQAIELGKKQVTKQGKRLYADSSVRTEVSRVYAPEQPDRHKGAGRHPTTLSPEEQKTHEDLKNQYGGDIYPTLQRLLRHTDRIELPLTVGEIDDDQTYPEGAIEWVRADRFERSKKAVAECKKYHGLECFVCHMRFAEVYGEVAKKFIHVHHLVPQSTRGEAYDVNPRVDLRPVCPNCHAVIHMRKPTPFTPDEVRAMLRPRK